MADSLSRWERVRAVLEGRKPDRPPVSVWRHFYEHEQTADGLVEAMLDFQARFGWDYMKVNPRAHYHVEDWGARYRYSGDPYTAPELEASPIRSPRDWEHLKALDPTRGVLGQHLKALERIRQGLKGEVPFLMTVFTPLSIAGRLAPSDRVLRQHLREHPKQVHAALQAITETFVRFVQECLGAGASGLFFATTGWATRDVLTPEEYREFGRPYDLRVLEAAAGASFNMLHVCRSHNMLGEVADYPVHCVNWDARDPTNPTLLEGWRLLQKPVVGGIPRDLHHLDPEEAARDTRTVVRQGRRFPLLLGSGCTISTRTPQAVLEAVADAARGEGARQPVA